MAARVIAVVGRVNMQSISNLENPFGYSAPIWQRFTDPSRSGRFAPETSAVFSGEAGTPAARSVLRLQFRFENGCVADARFQAYGCPTSIAVGAWLAEWAIGKSLSGLRGLRLSEMRTALEIGDDRAHCAVMGEDALLALLVQYPESSP